MSLFKDYLTLTHLTTFKWLLQLIKYENKILIVCELFQFLNLDLILGGIMSSPETTIYRQEILQREVLGDLSRK